MAEVPPIVYRALGSPGHALPQETRGFFEPRFGHDFSRVRIHADAVAAESAEAVDARAYTVGTNIVLGAGQYRPDSVDGQRLLAHELTHVVQQSGGPNFVGSPIVLAEPGDSQEREAEQRAHGIHDVRPRSRLQPSSVRRVLQRAMICSKRLQAPGFGWVANHAYVDDTGKNDCLGRGGAGNYAIQTLVRGNFVKGCAVKTANSTDPQEYKPNKKRCDPKPGVTDLSRCLRDTFDAYADPSLYQNPWGPNSNTFAATLAKTCCADGTSSGLGWVPGWDHSPAPPCPPERETCIAKYLGGGAYQGEDCIIRQGAGGSKL